MPSSDEKYRLLHHEVSDIGGTPALPLTIADHDLEPWEKRTHATLECLAWREVMSTEAKRRSVEDMGQTIYGGLTYYEKWITAAARFLMEHGYFTQDELAKRMDAVRARTPVAA
jgi:hypothetical protein